MTPLSCANIHCQTEAETTSGNSHGASSSARIAELPGKACRKNSASSMPMVIWPAIDSAVKMAVLPSAAMNR